MNNYVPLHVHSHYSLLDGLSKSEHIAKRCEELELEACALTDHGSIGGSIAFLKKMKNTKPILGCELYICTDHSKLLTKDNRPLSHTVVLAKNTQGWKQLVKIVSASNQPDSFYHKPRLSLKELATYLDGSIIGFSGHLGSTIAKAILDADGKLRQDWRTNGVNLARWMENAFGRDNFFLEVQLMMADVESSQKILVDAVRAISKETGIPCVATPDAHYTTKEQADDQRILLCSNMHTTLQEAYKPQFGLSGFFKTDHLHIPSAQEMLDYGHTEKELAQTVGIASMVEKYDILRNPVLPKFPCPDGHDEKSYLRELCRKGWGKLIKDKITDQQPYLESIQKELDVFEEANLSGYFLICQDIINFVRNSGWLPGPGRGSAAGCLVSYLIGITSIDPIKYDLLFERFYNAGRNTKDRVSLPDIDMDVPVKKRDEVIDYIKKQYGSDRVAQMVTYQTMKGRGALKDVFRAHGCAKFEEVNRMTVHIPDEARIADELQNMKEEFGKENTSIIRWALENNSKALSQWCQIKGSGPRGEKAKWHTGDWSDGLEGEFASQFAQAIRLEGTLKSQSKHAAGVIMAPQQIDTACPMILDTHKQLVCGLEMDDLESIGLVKLDILGVAMLDKVMGVSQILEYGDIQQ